MPTGFWYAAGEYTVEQSIPVSAYSVGDILMLTSASSLSRIPETWPSGTKFAGIAEGSSLQSISNKCTYLIPTDDTIFWASCDTALSSHLTVGMQVDVIFGLGNNRYYVTNSANSARVAIVRGTQEVDQSVQSRVQVRFLTSGAQNLFI